MKFFLLCWVRSLEIPWKFQWGNSIILLLAFVICFLPSCLSKILMWIFFIIIILPKVILNFVLHLWRRKKKAAFFWLCDLLLAWDGVLFLLLIMKIVMWNREVMKLFIYY